VYIYYPRFFLCLCIFTAHEWPELKGMNCRRAPRTIQPCLLPLSINHTP
jgi:hypothetical protein